MDKKILVFDLDGTIVDLYNQKNWLNDIINEKTEPYTNAKPMVDMNKLHKTLKKFKENNGKIIITTWLSKNSTEKYKKEVRIAKKEWLNRYNFEYDEIHLIQYGTTKANATRKQGKNQILIDDDDKIRKGWNLGRTINPKTQNILEELEKIC